MKTYKLPPKITYADVLEDNKERRLQIIYITILVILLPIILYFAGKSDYETAQILSSNTYNNSITN